MDNAIAVDAPPRLESHLAAAVRGRLATLNQWQADTARLMTEDSLLEFVRRDCRQLGLLVYHTHRSDRSEPGFPDLVILGAGGLLYRELKKEAGKVTSAQDEWLTALVRNAGADAGVWRPSDYVTGRIPTQLAYLAQQGRAAA